MAGDEPIWVLLGQHTGDNNQLMRLANEVGLPFRTVQLSYNRLSDLPLWLAGATFLTLDDDARAQLRPPWPDLVLGIGYRSVPAALAIRRLSGGHTRIVRLGNPRMHPKNFDLVITTSQYPVPGAPNVLRLPVGISTAPTLEPTADERAWLDKLPRPHRLLLIGGDTFRWELTPERVAEAAGTLRSRPGGSIIAVSSGRSSKAVVDRIAAELAGSDHGLVFGGFPRYPVLLHDADEIHVTADSVAMVSDAISTGKPVGLVTPRRLPSGRFFYALQKLRIREPVRDVRRFWTKVRSRGLAGTVEKPVAGKLSIDPLATAVSAVRKVLNR